MNLQNEKSVSYCGLFCPKCYKIIVSDAAESLNDALKNTHICGSVHEPSTEFKKELSDLVSLHCPNLCKDGGGDPNCEIRKCCLRKKLTGCWKCDNFETCKNLKKQFVENIKEINELGIEEFILNYKAKQNSGAQSGI